jgi:hypothetical protein
MFFLSVTRQIACWEKDARRKRRADGMGFI